MAELKLQSFRAVEKGSNSFVTDKFKINLRNSLNPLSSLQLKDKVKTFRNVLKCHIDS